MKFKCACPTKNDECINAAAPYGVFAPLLQNCKTAMELLAPKGTESIDGVDGNLTSAMSRDESMSKQSN